MIDETNEIEPGLQDLIDATNIGIIYLDGDLRIKLFTPATRQVFSITDADLRRPIYDVSSDLRYGSLKKDVEDVLESGQPVEHELPDKNGNWYLVRILPYATGGDSVRGVVLTFIDITKRMQAEQKIRWLSSAVESSNDAVFSFAFNRNIITWNAGAESIFGYLAEEAIGHPLSMLTQPGRESEETELVNKTWSGEKVEGFETVHMHKAGTAIDISLNLSPVRDENDRIVGMSATVRDITKRKEAAEHLRESEERHRLLVDSAKDYAILTLTPEGIVNSWNSGAERVFGFAEHEILGQPGHILFTPEDRANDVPAKEMKTALEKGRAEDERYHIRKDGSRFYASGVMTPLMDSKLHGFAKIARDLTQRKQAEDDLRQMQETLENRVVERTLELANANESLRQEIADRMSSEEIRIGLLRKIVTTQEDERRRIARDLHDQLGQRLTALRLKMASVREMVDDDTELAQRVQRLQEIGEQLDAEVSFLAWELRPTALDDLGMVAAIGHYVSEWSRHFEIEADFQSTGFRNGRLDPEIETNLYRITQEALNNVLKHASASGVNVLLERRKDKVVLIVEDDGVGFDPANAATVEQSGNGLGLIGMRERAALVGGQIEIESAPGKGTTIFVRVPFLRVEQKYQDGK
jgi:two-component system, chemotaxis family, CheB/CheR fusion protein